MIGDLLRFAPGHLGARQDRAPDRCEFRWWVVSSLPCVTPETSWNPSPREGGPGVLSGRDGNRQRATARYVSRGWLARERGQDGLGLLALRTMAGVRAGLRGGGYGRALAVKELRPLTRRLRRP